MSGTAGRRFDVQRAVALLAGSVVGVGAVCVVAWSVNGRPGERHLWPSIIAIVVVASVLAFSWVRAGHPAPQLKPNADLVGTSLVEKGVVKADAYLDGVETLIARYEADRYFAHRKEAGWKLDLIERMGIDVVRPTLPLEIVARRGPIGRTIIGFSSMVVHTLPTVLAGSDVQVVVCDIANEWYQPKARLQADDFLGRVSTSARRSYGLAAAAV